MCGICGQLNLEPEHAVDPEVIERMKITLAHRGPDSQGVWCKNSIGLGHTRLAVIDLSESGHQPMSNEDGTVWIVYNGEVYNFQDLKKELESKGHKFISRTDTEVIVHLYEEEGVKCVDRLRGMFAFAIWDENKKQLFLARDRLGQKPLYYYMDNEKFLFASEIKSILASGLAERVADNQALYQYLCLGYVPAPNTGFKNIRKLRAGSRMILHGKDLDVEPYWSVGADTDRIADLDEKTVCDRLLALIEESTRIRTVSDVPLGVLLSGGIDSNAVTAMMKRCTGRIKTFTIGFEDNLYDERKQAAVLAEKLGTDHHEMVVKPDIADILPTLVRAYDEPFADPSAVPSYYVAQMARQHVTVVLNGDGGDESFAGYGSYIQGMTGKWVRNIPAKLGGFLSEILDQAKPGKRRSLAQVLALSGRHGSEIFGSLKLIAPLDRIQSLLNQEYSETLIKTNPISHLVASYEKYDHGDTINTMLAVDRETFLPDDLLFKIDIAAMSHGLEARSPFLDHHLVEFAASLPGQLKLKGMRKKHILKQALKDVLPSEILERPKKGFDVPVGAWLKDELRDMSHDLLLSDSMSQQLLEKREVQSLLETHCAGKQDFGRLIWTLLNLEIWRREVLEA